MEMYEIYGVITGSISLLIGLSLLFFKKLDSILRNSDWTENDIKKTRLTIGVMAIIGGLLSLSAVLFGWPPIRGYVIPPSHWK